MVDRRLRHSTPRVTCLLHDVHSGEDHKDGEDHCADGVCDLSLVTEGPGPGGQRRGMDVWHGVVHREGGGEDKGEVSSATHRDTRARAHHGRGIRLVYTDRAEHGQSMGTARTGHG